MALVPFFFADRKDLPANARPKSHIPWPFAVACCLYYLLAYRGLGSATPIFCAMLEGIGFAPPLPTRFLFGTYRWLFPLVFVGAVILTMAKQFLPFNKNYLRAANAFLTGCIYLVSAVACSDLQIKLGTLSIGTANATH